MREREREREREGVPRVEPGALFKDLMRNKLKKRHIAHEASVWVDNNC